MRPTELRELRPKPIDRVAVLLANLEQARGTSWALSKQRKMHHRYGEPINDEGDYVYYDGSVVGMFRLDEHLDMERYFPSYQYLGTTTQQKRDFDNGRHYIGARITKLEYPKLPDVDIQFDEFGIGFDMIIGTLKFQIATINPYLFDRHAYYQRAVSGETACDVIMRRTEPRNGDDQGGWRTPGDFRRNPRFARPSFLREFTTGMQQLRLMGMKTAFGRPTDQRRLDIYQSMGMEAFEEGDTIYTQLDLEHWPRLQR